MKKFYHPTLPTFSLTDSSETLKIGTVASSAFANRFKANTGEWHNDSFNTHWLRLEVKSDLAVDKQLLSTFRGVW